MIRGRASTCPPGGQKPGAHPHHGGAACGTRGRGIRSACRTAVHDGRPKRSSLRGRIGIDVGGRTKLTHGSGASAAQNNAGNLGTCGHHASGGSTAADGGLTSSTRATPMVRVPSNRWTPGETGASSSPDREHRGSTPARRIPAATTAKANRATRADSGLGATCGGRGFDSRRLHSTETAHTAEREGSTTARRLGHLSRTIRTPNVTAVRHASYPPGVLMPSTRPKDGARLTPRTIALSECLAHALIVMALVVVVLG